MDLAINPNGQGVNTIQVSPGMAGTKELNVKFNAVTGNATNVVIVPDALTVDAYLGGGKDNTKVMGVNGRFVCDALTDDLQAYLTLMGRTGYVLSAINMETDDQENFKQNLNITTIDHTGTVNTVRRDLARYRRSVGNGYASDITLQEDIYKHALMKLVLPKIKLNTYISITFYFSAVADVANMRPFNATQY